MLLHSKENFKERPLFYYAISFSTLLPEVTKLPRLPFHCHWWDLNGYDIPQCFKAWKAAGKTLIKACSFNSYEALEFIWTPRYVSDVWALKHMNIRNNGFFQSAIDSQRPWVPHICGFNQQHVENIPEHNCGYFQHLQTFYSSLISHSICTVSSIINQDTTTESKNMGGVLK